MQNKWLVHSGIVRFNLTISGDTPTECKVASDNLCLWVQWKKIQEAINLISTTEFGMIKKWEISLHILKEELVIGGGKIWHHVSQIASGVTDDQNKIIIIIIF